MGDKDPKALIADIAEERPTELSAIKLDQEVFGLRLSGVSPGEIAYRLGISETEVQTRIRKMRTRMKAEMAADAYSLALLEDARLSALLEGLWGQATAGDVQAVRACIEISKERRKLFGLDAPVRLDIFADTKPPQDGPSDAQKLAALSLDELKQLQALTKKINASQTIVEAELEEIDNED